MRLQVVQMVFISGHLVERKGSKKVERRGRERKERGGRERGGRERRWRERR